MSLKLADVHFNELYQLLTDQKITIEICDKIIEIFEIFKNLPNAHMYFCKCLLEIIKSTRSEPSKTKFFCEHIMASVFSDIKNHDTYPQFVENTIAVLCAVPEQKANCVKYTQDNGIEEKTGLEVCAVCKQLKHNHPACHRFSKNNQDSLACNGCNMSITVHTLCEAGCSEWKKHHVTPSTRYDFRMDDVCIQCNLPRSEYERRTLYSIGKRACRNYTESNDGECTNCDFSQPHHISFFQ